MHQTFAQLPDYDSETDQYNTPNRHYNPTGRWLSPDPGGVKVVKLDDPQTWNMYAYVRNNPTTATDPTGLDLWLRGCDKRDKRHCHKNYVGSFNDKGKFVPTTIQSDASGNFKGHTVSFDTSGIHIDSKYQGVFASGTAATVVNGSGLMEGFQLRANTNNFGTATAGGELSALPGHSLSELGSLLTHIPGEDLITGHPGTQLRGGNANGPDIHVSFVGGVAEVGAHFDWSYPGTWDGLQQHYRDYRAFRERSKTMTGDPDYELVGPQPED
jgi:RHS repeat-associated protein